MSVSPELLHRIQRIKLSQQAIRSQKSELAQLYLNSHGTKIIAIEKNIQRLEDEIQQKFTALFYFLIESGYTQLAMAAISFVDMPNANPRLIDYPADHQLGQAVPEENIFDLNAIAQFVHSQQPENNQEMLTEIARSVALVEEVIKMTDQNSEIAVFHLNTKWTWRKGEDKPRFAMNPHNQFRFLHGHYTADELYEWATQQTGPVVGD